MKNDYLKGVMDSSIEYLGAMINAFDWEDGTPIGAVFNRFKDAYDIYMRPDKELQKLLPMPVIAATVLPETMTREKDFNTEGAKKKKRRERRKSPAIEKLTVSEDFYADASTLKKAIDKLCVSYGLSYWQLQKFANIGGATWAKIVAGQTNIKGNTVAKLKKKLCIPDRLFSVENKPEKKQKKESAPPAQKPPAESQKPLNEDGSDPSGDEDWIKCRKEENHKRLEAEKGR